MKEIWVLGSEHSKAHKNISWHHPFPNFTNSDILIVNLESLDATQLQRIKDTLYDEARKYVFDMLMAGKVVFVITSTDQDALNWLPIFPVLKKISPGRLGEKSGLSIADEYLEKVEECSYYIKLFDYRYFLQKTDPRNEKSERYFFSREAEGRYYGETELEHEITNRAKQTIGGALRFKISYGGKYAGYYAEKFFSGPLIFLPPPTKVTVEEAIDRLLSFLVGGETTEPPPPWEQQIEMPGLSSLTTQIAGKEDEKEKLIEEIKKLEGKLNDVVKLRRLLWADGEPLEDIVREAFTILGFQEIRKIRAPNLEDWVIDFQHVDEFKHGVFEIKGAEKRTSLADLTQCNKWVEDYLLDNLKVKGIFVSNQYRRIDIRKSLEKREEFAPNEFDYARKREICILPTHEILNAVIAKMKKYQEITRESIEKKIASANGLCKLI